MHNCLYTTQGRVVCTKEDSKEKKQKDLVEHFLETPVHGLEVVNKKNEITIVERPLSTKLWDKNDAKIRCTNLCKQFDEKWNNGYRSEGGSACYCVPK
jgi:hypothetical protein